MKKVNNVLWSGRSYGGGEVYCSTMNREWQTTTIALETLTFMGWISLISKIFTANEAFIFHDLRASTLSVLAPWGINDTVILGPGKNLKVTKLIINLLSKIQRHVILVDRDLLPTNHSPNTIVVENFSDAGITASNTSRDAVYIGRLAASKRVVELCNTWIHTQRADTLHVIGDGPEREAVTRLASEYGRIKVYGAIPHNALSVIASKCSYYVSLSKREGLSLSLLEAMAGGLFPVVADIPSQAFLKTTSAALVVNDEDQTANQLECFFSKIESLPDVERDQLRASIKNLVKGRFYDNWLNFWDSEINALRTKHSRTKNA